MEAQLVVGRVRVAAVWVGTALLVAFARPSPTGAAVGAGLVGVGELLRVWAAGHLVKNEELVTSGPYRHTRNPLYLGRLAIFTGLCVMARLPHGLHLGVLAAGWLVFFGYYLPRKERVEPARLAALHGEAYARYRCDVPPLWPRALAWPGGSRKRWSLRRALGNREHWMVVVLAVVVAYLLGRADTA